VKQIFVCTNHRGLSGQASCGARGSESLLALLQTELRNRSLDYLATSSVCLGHCEKGPNIKVLGEGCNHEMDQKGVFQLLDELEKAQGLL
jgi:NADH:ubiquinone oxidoreductase subunit E